MDMAQHMARRRKYMGKPMAGMQRKAHLQDRPDAPEDMGGLRERCSFHQCLLELQQHKSLLLDLQALQAGREAHNLRLWQADIS